MKFFKWNRSPKIPEIGIHQGYSAISHTKTTLLKWIYALTSLRRPHPNLSHLQHFHRIAFQQWMEGTWPHKNRINSSCFVTNKTRKSQAFWLLHSAEQPQQDHNQRQCYCPETFWIAQYSPITSLIRMPPPGCNALPFWSFWSIIHLFEKLGSAMLQTNWGVHTDSSDILLPSPLRPPSASGTQQLKSAGGLFKSRQFSKISKRMFNTSVFPGHRPKSMYLKGVQAHKPSKMPQASGNPKDELPMHRTHHHSTKGFQASFSSVALDIGTTCRDMPWKIFEESRNLVCLIHFG